ncbi:MAG: hypothetical protein NUV78_00410 [Candidatus Zambryskibacteria bacterium]|nr:hypothetical protein [Candidatus Zambryskibacteria bacterium]
MYEMKAWRGTWRFASYTYAKYHGRSGTSKVEATSKEEAEVRIRYKAQQTLGAPAILTKYIKVTGVSEVAKTY